MYNKCMNMLSKKIVRNMKLNIVVIIFLCKTPTSGFQVLFRTISIYLSIYLSIYVSIYLSVYVRACVCVSV